MRLNIGCRLPRRHIVRLSPPCQLTLVLASPKYNTMQIQIHIQLQIQHNRNIKTHTSTNATQCRLNIVFGLLKYNTNRYQIQRYITIHVYCPVERYIWITNEIQRCEQFGWFTSVPISMYYNAMHIIIIPSPN